MANPIEAGKEAINKLANAALSSQLDEVDSISVNVSTSSRLAEGEIDAVTIDGEGLIAADQVRTDALHLEIGSILVNPWKAVLGKIELKETVEGTAEMTFTAEDINQVLDSSQFKQDFYTHKLIVNGQSAHPTLCCAKVDIKKQELNLKAEIEFNEIDYPVQAVDISMRPTVDPKSRRLVFETIADESRASQEAIAILTEQLSQLFDTCHFDKEGIDVELTHCQLVPNGLVLKTNVHIQELPST